MTKIYFGKRPTGSIIKLALLPWLQIYHDNKENRRASSDSLMDGYIITFMALIICWLYKNYVGKVSPLYPDCRISSLVIVQKNQFVIVVTGLKFKKKK